MTSATMYNGSKGPVVIATMNGKHAAMAAAKLRREAPARTAEIEALEAHAARMEAEHAAANSDDANPRAVIGGNMPPEEIETPKLSGREAIEAHVGDLLAEAGNWTDGIAIENQGQADSVSRLRRMLQQSAEIVDDAAADEKRPHNDAIAEIGAWQNGFTAKGLKKTPDGKITTSLALLTRLDTAWLLKLEAERKAEAERIAAEAAAAAAEALAAHHEAQQTTDIAVVESAEDKLSEARALLKQAESADKARVHSGGGDGLRASSLRSYWLHEVTDYNALLKHVMQTAPETLRAALNDFAQSEVARGVRSIPGVNITEEKRAA